MCARACCARVRVPKQAKMSLLRPSGCYAHVRAHVLCAHARAKSGHNEPPEAFCGCFAYVHACMLCVRARAKTGKNEPPKAFWVLRAFRDTREKHPEVQIFPGRGERNTPVTGARGIVEAKALRSQAEGATLRRINSASQRHNFPKFVKKPLRRGSVLAHLCSTPPPIPIPIPSPGAVLAPGHQMVARRSPGGHFLAPACQIAARWPPDGNFEHFSPRIFWPQPAVCQAGVRRTF